MENKIPPPLVLIAFLLLMRGISRLDPLLNNYFALASSLGVAFAALGVSIAIASFMSFAKAKTTIDPLRPKRASSLVTTGMFSVSRNPMYLGMVFVALGYAFYLQSPIAMLLVFGFIAYIKRYQILPEERAMQELFGDEFVEYCSKTRRWL